MNNQPTPNSAEQIPHMAPEAMQGAIMPELAPAAPEAPEVTPQSTVAADNAGAPAAQQLSAADVSAAIAAVPVQQNTVAPATPPLQADDVDVVEPEWVDAAEQVIARTAGNPYQEEEAFETLQVDYLKKRYGHEVKKPEDK